MKINKWTLGLAAVGLVSLASVARAEEAAQTPLLTALSATTISGYVDTSAVWNPGTGNAHPAPYAFNAGKQDGFNVDSVDIKLAKPLTEGNWAAGYTLEFMAGPDAVGITAGAGIRQAFVELRVPVGNGIDLKIGRFDNLLGYESSDSYKNPNWTRSYGYSIEPTEHEGVLATYQVNNMFSAQLGVVDSVTTTGLNSRGTGPVAESKKGIISLVTLTAPDSWGAIKGSSLYAGIDYGPGLGLKPGTGTWSDRTEIYVGATINTPVKDLTFGAAYDAIYDLDVAGVDTGFGYTVAGYGSYKFTDKASFNARAEYGQGDFLSAASGYGTYAGFNKVFALTGTFEYDLWANVISRLELRWDHACDGTAPFGGDAATFGFPNKKNEVLLAANVVYKF